MLGEKEFAEYTKNVHELKAIGADVVIHLPYGRDNDLLGDEEGIDRIKKAIAYAKQFNAKLMTLHLGYINNHNREDVFAYIKPMLCDLCELAEGATIMIENMPSETELGYSPDEIKKIIDLVNKPNLKFIFDCGHANVSIYSNDDYLDLLMPYLTHIHLSDNKGERDSHARIGSGTIDFKYFLSKLNEYRGYYCMEVLYKDVEDLINYSQDLDNLF
jgi:sugar phosphate isomerase/epimerase